MESVRKQIQRGLFGLQFRTTVLLTGIVLAATALTGITYMRIATQLAVADAKLQARSLGRAIAINSARKIVNDDRVAMMAVAEEMVLHGGLNYVIFTDMTGHILACHQRGAGRIAEFVLDGGHQISVEPIDHPIVVDMVGCGTSVDIVYPVMSLLSESQKRSSTVGYVRLGVSMQSSQSRLDGLIRTVIGLAVGIALLMVPLGFEVVRHVVGPVERLSRAARDLAGGKLDSRVAIKRRDEIGELADSFNGMADDLARSQNQLIKLNAELEDRVLQRTQALEEANHRLQEMAVRDPLTGLYNRHHFNDLLNQLFAESHRYQTELTCMMLDLDNFKRVNDTLGHQTGDRLLQLTADVIRDSIRASDIAVRYGGDEIAVLLPHTSPSEARASAERILQRFREEIAGCMPQAGIASLSIGMVSRDRDQPATALEMVNLADEALYLAKAAGKNRVTVCSPYATA